jgi:hypothetical protein
VHEQLLASQEGLSWLASISFPTNRTSILLFLVLVVAVVVLAVATAEVVVVVVAGAGAGTGAVVVEEILFEILRMLFQ